MPTEIRPLAEDELPAFAVIAANAYPAFQAHSAEERHTIVQRWIAQAADPTISNVGAFRDGRLVGAMKLYDFTMNVRGAQLPTGGVGMVAVDLLHKKQRVAFDLIQHFLHHYRERGATLTELYPFRPDFYKQMGFGYGTKMSEYRARTESFPAGPGRERLRTLTIADAPALLECYNRYQAATHGMIRRDEFSFPRRFANPAHHAIGYERDGRLTGYLLFDDATDPNGNFVLNDLIVEELVYETPDALAALLAFLRSQADQFRTVVIRTQDPTFHHLLADPRDDSGRLIPSVYHQSDTQGVGLMYRVIDLPGVFAALAGRDFNGQTIRLQITLDDSFFPENAGPVTVAFDSGQPHVTDDPAHDAAIRLDVTEFSSLLLGAVSFKRLHQYGLAQLSDPSALEVIDRLFRVDDPPICMTAF
jgi:predicted acetyltransferase